MIKLKNSSLPIHGVEVTLFSIIIILIGYFINHNDPLLIEYKFSTILLCLSVVTLFYGIEMGVLMWSIFAIFLLLTDKDNPMLKPFLLEHLFFVALFSLFFYNYKKSLNYTNIQNSYLKRRLKEFHNSFFTLKMSHDKLESTYISQPTSLRYVLTELLDNEGTKSTKNRSKNLLKMLEKNFMVKKSMIWKVKQGVVHEIIASNGECDKELDSTDPLLQEALIHKKAMYLKDLKDKEQTKYIFVIPYLDENEEVTAVLIIQDIPFLFYREDVIIKINIIFNYIWIESEKRVLIEKIFKDNNINEEQEVIDFKIEVMRLQKIQKKFDINSRIYAIRTENPYLHESVSEYFYKNNSLHVLDQYLSLQCKENYLHFIILPFTLANGMDMLTKDFNTIIQKMQSELEVYLGEKSYKDIETKSISINYFKDIWEEFGCVER